MWGPGRPRVFVDANVWYSRTLRDWIGLLYTLPEAPPFVVFWTEDVMAEVFYHLRRQHPHWEGRRISAVRDQLAQTFEAGRLTDFDVPSHSGPDPHDAHIHAAAVACFADYLVTFNVSDFQWDEQITPYAVLHPDEFLVEMDAVAPHIVDAATSRMTSYWLNKRGEADLPSQLRRAQCPAFSQRVRRHLQNHM